ncbi:MAG: polyphosphate kinase 2 family protein [Pyrinomonadaceae bacterium]|nr:polyphosphate kinase 2 family protein [Pyrinomonadaceae bacterium]MDQ3135754.1 polyphosphate kinase 2 family protein [Acidobacteriota bacterium]
MNHDQFIVPPGKKIRLKDYDPTSIGKFKDKTDAKKKLCEDIERLAKYQDMLYAQNTHALLVILQAMDAAGKDGTIRHVMSGVNPQGTQVYSFKSPSSEELDHDYLWRSMKALPERGRIGIFNRSYYEELLVVRVHPEILSFQQLPADAKDKNIWKRRFEEINNFENYLVHNGIHILKFFLNVSKDEQKRRFLARINTPEKNWKFSLSDAKERGHWDDYMVAFEDAFNHTSTEHAPWYIVPADNKWFTRTVVADVIINKLKSLNLSYPVVSEAHMENLLKAKALLESEPAA